MMQFKCRLRIFSPLDRYDIKDIYNLSFDDAKNYCKGMVEFLKAQIFRIYAQTIGTPSNY